jgi:hypothetical protein
VIDMSKEKVKRMANKCMRALQIVRKEIEGLLGALGEGGEKRELQDRLVKLQMRCF